MKYRIFVMLVVFLPYLVGCDFLYRILDKEGAQEKELVGVVSPFEKNPTVEEIQILLKLYGYNPGKIDGVLGLRTRNSIEKFQRDHNLKTSRFVDDETWAKLSIFKRNGMIQEGQLNTKLVQELLKTAGFDVGQIDGKFGPKTKTAVQEFQKAHNLKVDGKVGYNTMHVLSQFMNVPQNPQSAQ